MNEKKMEIIHAPGSVQRMFDAISKMHRARVQGKYQAPAIRGREIRTQPNLREARPAAHKRAQDEGRPKEMSGRQWKRLKKAERCLAARGTEGVFQRQRAPLGFHECRERIDRAHASCDRPDTGHPFIGRGGVIRQLRTSLEV